MTSQIILTSSIASVATDVHERELKGKGYDSILFIDTAAEGVDDDDLAWLEADLQSLVDQGYEVKRYSVTEQSLEVITKEIDAHDIIYMCGGNTVYLLDQLQKTGAFALIQDRVRSGKPYIGTSAGSIVAGPDIPPYLREGRTELGTYEGFCFTNVVVVPHWGSPHFKEEYLGRRIAMAYREDLPPFLLLNDDQYIVVREKGVEVVNVQS